MPTYMMLVKYTDQGIRNIKEKDRKSKRGFGSPGRGAEGMVVADGLVERGQAG